METQAFSLFLEEHNRPKVNIFDEWVDKAMYRTPIDEIMSKYVNVNRERFPEIVTMPELKKPSGQFSGDHFLCIHRM
jgi:hypothetical protein